MTNEHSSLEKYTSHFIRKGCKRVMCERWVGDWTNCNILTPSSFVFSSTSFLFCWAAQSGVLRAHSPLLGAGSLYSILSLTRLTPTLTETVCRTGLYHCLIPTCTEFNPSTVIYPDIFDRMHLFLDWRLVRRSICYNKNLSLLK